MSETDDYKESVLFTFIKNERILCEWRERFGVAQYSIPGGKIDPADQEHSDYQVAALFRETWEEFRVIPTQFHRVGEIWHKDEWLFHVYLVSAWEGEIPTQVLDSQRRLDWIDHVELQDNVSMLGISALIRRALSNKFFVKKVKNGRNLKILCRGLRFSSTGR